MDETSFSELYKSVQLRRFFRAEAGRLLSKDEDLQEAAAAEAWKRILAQPDGLDFDDYKKHGARAIKAVYKRVRRRLKTRPPRTWRSPGKLCGRLGLTQNKRYKASAT
jgi:hypothetical protein